VRAIPTVNLLEISIKLAILIYLDCVPAISIAISIISIYFDEVAGKGSFAEKGMLTTPRMLRTLGWKGLSVTATTGRS
jgi:hypothetical protein